MTKPGPIDMEKLCPYNAIEWYLESRDSAENLRRRPHMLLRRPFQCRQILRLDERNPNRARTMMDEDGPSYSHHITRSPMLPGDQEPADGAFESGQPSQEPDLESGQPVQEPDLDGLQHHAAAGATPVSDEFERDVKPHKSKSKSPVSDESESEFGSTETEEQSVDMASEQEDLIDDITKDFRRLLKRRLPSETPERKTSKGESKRETDPRENMFSQRLKEIMIKYMYARKNSPKPSPDSPDDEGLQSKDMGEQEEKEEEPTSQDTSDEEDLDETDSEDETTQEFIAALTKDEEDVSKCLVKTLAQLESQRGVYTSIGQSVEQELRTLEERRNQTAFLLMTMDPFQDPDDYRDLQHQAQRHEAKLGRLKNIFGVLDSLLSALQRYSDQVQETYDSFEEDIRRNLGHSFDDEPEEQASVEDSQ